MKLKTQNRYSSASLATALTLIASSTTPSLAYGDSYNDVCGGTQKISNQKQQYCTAAKQAQDASKKEKTLTLLYSAVAGTCAATCLGMIGSDFVCQGAALGASVTDILITKNFMSGLMSGGTAAFGLLQDKTDGPGKKFGCWANVASSTLNAITHGMSKSNDEKMVNSNLNSAKSVTDNGDNAYNYGGLNPGGTPGGSTSLASTNSTATVLKPSSSDPGATPSNGCGDTSTVAGAATCAATADQKIADMVSSPDFQKAFEKSSGVSLADFLKNGGNLSPSDAIKASSGAALSGDASVQLGKAIAAVEKEVPNLNSEVSATYAAGGGGGKSGSGDPDLATMMNGLMGKLMPKSEQDKKSGVSEVKFNGPVRNLASATAEDPTVSLFERVAFRYSHVTPRLLSDPSKRTLSDWSTTSPATSATSKRN